MLYDIGRVCVKKAGKEAGKYCVVLERLDNNYVLIDGEVLRKRCNVAHLEPLDIVLKLKKTSDKQEILGALAKEKLIAKEKRSHKKKDKSNVKNEKPNARGKKKQRS